MTWRKRIGLRIILLLAVVVLPALAPSPAVADPYYCEGDAFMCPDPPAVEAPGSCTSGVEAKCVAGAAGTYTVDFDSAGARYWYIVCLKSTTTMRRASPKDRVCTKKADGILLNPNWTFFITVDYTAGDSVYIDFEMFITVDDSRTKNDIDLAGAHNCDFNGLVSNGRLWCDEWKTNVPSAMTYTRPTLTPYTIDVNNPNEPVMHLINLLAWLVSAAAVAGLLITAVQLGLQLRRGVTGEKATEYVRPLALICGACLLAATAGPLVQFFGFDQGRTPSDTPSVQATTTPTLRR